MVTLQRLLLGCLLLGLFASCSSHQTWKYRLGLENGAVQIDMDGVTLIFDGIPHDGRDSANYASGSIVVAGTGTLRSKVTTQDLRFEQSYAEGVNTMSFAGHEFVLSETGSKLRIGSQEFDLSTGKPMILIAEDGTASVRGD